MQFFILSVNIYKIQLQMTIPVKFIWEGGKMPVAVWKLGTFLSGEYFQIFLFYRQVEGEVQNFESSIPPSPDNLYWNSPN